MTTPHSADPAHKNERGNVLFLILIAVILFAALSYAVTQSSRSGGGDAGRETNLISSAEVTQYPAAVKTAILRMVINGTAHNELKFNQPSDFTSLGSDTTEGVFHPDGGGAVYSTASPDIMDSGGGNAGGTWYFNPKFEVLNIGTSTTSSGDGNEFIAFLPGIKQAICKKLNEESNGITTIPTASTIADTAVKDIFDTSDSETIPNETAIIGTATGTTSLAGQPAGCFLSSNSHYVYYQVLVER